MNMDVRIVSAEEEIFSGEAGSVFALSTLGEVGIFPGHSPLIAQLRPGEVRVVSEGEDEKRFYVSGGVLEVQPHVVTVLADVALRGEDLDEERALEAKRKAEEMLESASGDLDTAAVLSEIAEAAAQLRMIEELRKARK